MDIDSGWLREFCGFFWGEGNFMIDIWQKKMLSKRRLADGTMKEYGYRMQQCCRVRVRIIQREDDRQVLEHLVKNLGGHIYTHKSRKMVSGGNGRIYTNNKQLVWQVQDRRQVERILDILERGVFPAKKHQEIEIMRKAIYVLDNHARGWPKEDVDKLRALKTELSKHRAFSGS